MTSNTLKISYHSHHTKKISTLTFLRKSSQGTTLRAFYIFIEWTLWIALFGCTTLCEKGWMTRNFKFTENAMASLRILKILRRARGWPNNFANLSSFMVLGVSGSEQPYLTGASGLQGGLVHAALALRAGARGRWPAREIRFSEPHWHARR